MTRHDQFLRLCAAACAGELTPEEHATLEAHLASCTRCRQAMGGYEAASKQVLAELALDTEPPETESNSRWSVEEAEKRFFKRLDTQGKPSKLEVTRGQRSAYRHWHCRWPELGMSLAAVVLLSMALAVVAYRSGVKRAADVARTLPQPVKQS